MNVSTNEIIAIALTLPIGLYAKRRVSVSVVDGEQTSYYNPITDEIIISADIIKQALTKVNDDDDIEKAVRSMVYHELSHAILTPSSLHITDAVNVFEDERIETLLQNYYLDTDFKKQVYSVNGFESEADIPTPSTPMEKFYTTVRFRIGEEEHLKEVDKLIEKYKSFSRDTNRWELYEYPRDINNLYYLITGEYPRNSESKRYITIDFGDGGDGSAETKNRKSKREEKDGKDGASAPESNTGGEPAHGRAIMSNKEIEAVFNHVLNENKYYDSKLTAELEMLIENFNKKNNSGASFTSYSGVFNPRLAGNENYRYFERIANVNGANKFGTFHLNLFIDESGSFYASEPAMNTLLRSLTEIEKRNKNFSLDVVFCGMGERIITDKRNRTFKASGGNRLDKKTYEIFRKLQKPNTYNYNIACFDGDACSDGGRSDHGFGAFNHSNCTIISDTDNKRYIDTDVSSAKVIYTKRYAEELIKNVTDTIAKAFR